MIPEFPIFKKLELTDKKDVECITSKYKPYSDFNFVSMWSWNVNNEIAISILHDNLVLCFTDYVTNELFHTFIGNNKVNETAKDLIDFSSNNNLSPILRLIPEISIQDLCGDTFEVLEDIDNFDYIYSIEELRDLLGGKFSKVRNNFNIFVKEFPQAKTNAISLTDPEIVESILKLCSKWQDLKAEKEGILESHDQIAIKRMLDGVNKLNLIAIGVFIDDKLVAFSVNELLDSDYVIAHTMKADASISRGLNAFLIKKSAEILSSYNKKFINYEQDLGIESLRISKTRLRPISFLKKYIIRCIK